MVTQINHPSTTFTGTDFLGTAFTAGVGYTSSPAAVSEYRLRGYGVGGNAPATVDSRNVVPVVTGTPPGTKRMNNGVAEVFDQLAGPVLNKAGQVTSPPTYGWRVETNTVGTPARDAAVAPVAGDYKPPSNAGKADPHGPDVVSPGIDR